MKGGTLKVLAVSTAKRVPTAPDVPTVAEVSGIGQFDFTLWSGVFAPKGIPKELAERLNAELNKALRDPEVEGRLTESGVQITIMSPAQFTSFVQAESAKYLDLIRETGIRPQ